MAVVIILALAAACATATFLESLYDIPTARYWVYKTLWFKMILLSFGVCIFAVMVDRWPWKKKHGPFLMAHIGILTLLVGSWLTDRFGLDGSMRVTEGETTSVVDLDSPLLVLTEGSQMSSFPVQWLPPDVKFKPFSVKDRGAPYDIRVVDYITHADPIFHFVPKNEQSRAISQLKQPALKFKLTGGPMKVSQDFWMWTGDPSTQAFQAGPAHLEFINDSGDKSGAEKGADATKRASHDKQPPVSGKHGPTLTFRLLKGGVLAFHSQSSSGEVRDGRVLLAELAGKAIDPGWKGVSITLEEFIPDAWVNATYQPSRLQYGEMAPPSAIRVVAGEPTSEGVDVWLQIGSRAVLHTGGRDVEIGYYNRRLMLPFAVRLDRFSIERYQGTMNPAAYSSQVTVMGSAAKSDSQLSQLISMNEPLLHDGITLYQASFEDNPELPRPVTSILSVNRDPGRIWKYLGSLLIVMGSVWLFGLKYRLKKKMATLTPSVAIDAAEARGV